MFRSHFGPDTWLSKTVLCRQSLTSTHFSQIAFTNGMFSKFQQVVSGQCICSSEYLLMLSFFWVNGWKKLLLFLAEHPCYRIRFNWGLYSNVYNNGGTVINAVVSQDEGLQFDPIIWPGPFCVQFAWVLSSYSDLRVMSLHLAVNLLYLLICSLLFMVDWIWIHILPGECCSLGWLLWRGFSSSWKWFCDHPPLLFSMVVQVFLCYWAHQCFLCFSGCTTL